MRSAVLLALVVLASNTTSALHAVEPWTDPRLPVRTGLELWLDAARPADKHRPPGPLDV